jgi:3-oxoacyl-(acyl-carrier-protein) synthase
MNISIQSIGAVLPIEGQFSIPDFDLKNYPVAPKTYLDRASALALAACGLALKNANLSGPLGDEFGLCIGTQFGAVQTMAAFESKLFEAGAKTVSPLLFSHSGFNAPAAIISIEWGLRGHHAPFCGARSGLDAVEAARDALLLGQAERMLCGAVEANSPARRWSGEADEGEGAVFLVLEREGQGQPLEEWLQNSREIWGNWGALSELRKRLA